MMNPPNHPPNSTPQSSYSSRTREVLIGIVEGQELLLDALEDMGRRVERIEGFLDHLGIAGYNSIFDSEEAARAAWDAWEQVVRNPGKPPRPFPGDVERIKARRPWRSGNSKGANIQVEL